MKDLERIQIDELPMEVQWRLMKNLLTDHEVFTNKDGSVIIVPNILYYPEQREDASVHSYLIENNRVAHMNINEVVDNSALYAHDLETSKEFEKAYQIINSMRKTGTDRSGLANI